MHFGLVCQGLSTMIWPSLHYPLTISTIPEPACSVITKEFYKALLPKLGWCQLLLPSCSMLYSVGFSTASPVLTFMYQCPHALPFCTMPTGIFPFVPFQSTFHLSTVPMGTSQIQSCNSSKHDIYLLLIGHSLNANLPSIPCVQSDTLSHGILWLTHLDSWWVHHRILFSDAGDMLTYLIQSS